MEVISKFTGWFLENFTSADVQMVQMILTLGLSCVLAGYLFLIYRVVGRKTIYSKRYSIMIASMVVITTAMIFAVYSSVRLSLGMVGALAIVRFRTAVKDALDIVFLFWAIAAGICCGAHMTEIALILSAVVTILILGLDRVSSNQRNRLLLVEVSRGEAEEKLLQTLEKECTHYKLKAKEVGKQGGKIIAEIKVKHEYQTFKRLCQIEGISSISMIHQEGEHSY